MTDDSTRREAGLAKMVEVYGDDRGFTARFENLPPEGAPYTNETVEQVFAGLWSRPGLSVRDRRLLTIGVTAALGRGDLAEVQFTGALKAGELDREELGEVVLHLAYYAGWPCASAMHRAATAAVANVLPEA